MTSLARDTRRHLRIHYIGSSGVSSSSAALSEIVFLCDCLGRCAVYSCRSSADLFCALGLRMYFWRRNAFLRSQDFEGPDLEIGNGHGHHEGLLTPGPTGTCPGIPIQSVNYGQTAESASLSLCLSQHTSPLPHPMELMQHLE
ncbi:hypothetical protein XELAEV_18046873mg [Xenopus laevis]|uniref:Uncharacterized protein n=1 Tax=Xenopus laevis TaxID=8355 RepID=A0A974BU64_XENLA|nr:hypothetical protein XELAEV_18046873mg [Xenopus laevis]